jgi:hypothetical protein
VTAPGAGPARHQRPEIDSLALAAARTAERVLEAARARGLERWQEFLAPLPDLLRDADLAELRRTARRARAAYGPKDSIRDALPIQATEALLNDLDRLLAALVREEMAR